MLRIIFAGIFLISGLFVLATATFGIFRFSTMLNRVHVAAKCDTLGALLILTGLIIVSGFNIFSLKLFMVLLFLWLSNPVASHLVARAEVRTNSKLHETCDFFTQEELKNADN